jgi:hypothetical protein
MKIASWKPQRIENDPFSGDGSRERRRARRRPSAAVGIICPDSSTPVATAGRLEVLVMNISAQGVGFRAPVDFDAGMHCLLKIGAGAVHLTSRLRIVGSRLREDGLYDVGARFVAEAVESAAA